MATVEIVATPVHILRNSAVTLSASFYSDGILTDPGTTTVGIVDAAGTVEVAAGTATVGTGAAARTYALAAAATDELDTLTVTWTTANVGTLTTTHEIVGAFLFSVNEARAFDGNAMANTTTYPTADIETARARILDEFEQITGVSFVPRYRLDTYSGTGGVGLMIDRLNVTDIRTVETREAGTATWTAYTTAQLDDLYTDSWGNVERETLGTFLSGRRNVRIGYEYGYTQVPHDIRRAALLAARYELVDNNYSDRTISTSNEFGTTQFWTPGLSGRGSAIHPLPEVDRILKLYISKVPVVA